MKPLILWLVPLTGLLVAADAPKEDVQKELDKLKGVWVAESAMIGGKNAPREILDKIEFTFDGNKVMHEFLEGDSAEIKLNPAKKPRTMDFTNKNRTELAIYELDGDVLKICVNTDSAGKRPEEFESKEGSSHMLVVLKRRKSDK